jgi:hypothetical protein
MKAILTRASALLVAALLLTGCGAPPPGVGPTTRVQPTADGRPPEERLGQAMLTEIAANEQKLGRALALPRIIRIVRLDAGELYQLKHLDGSNPDGGAMGPSAGPGWMVEAVGTFIDEDPSTGRIDSIGTHGFHLWDDAGGESAGFIPCWTRQATPPDRLEGRCEGVS